MISNNKFTDTDFENKNIISIKDICNDFYNFSIKYFEPYNINSKKKQEIEINILNPSINIFTNLYNYKSATCSSYIEIKNTINNTDKIRLRKNINEFTLYVNNKLNILETYKNESWDKKKIKQIKINNNYIMKCSNESKISFNSNKIVNLGYYYVNSIYIKNSYFKLEIRLKTVLNLPDNDNNLLLSYFNKNNTKRNIELEIELNEKLTSLDKNEFMNQFIKIMQYGYGCANSSFYFCFSALYPNLHTNMINISNLLSMDHNNMLITKKVDGKHVQFYIKNSICYIVKYNIIQELNCNIPSEYVLAGAGEFLYVKKNRYLMPFHIQYIHKSSKPVLFNTKLQALKYVSKITKNTSLSNLKKKKLLNLDEQLDVIVYIKTFYGPYDSQKEFLKNVIACYNKIEFYTTDGIIISDNNQISFENIIDFKFKENNTIDLYTNLNINKPKQSNLLKFDLSFIATKNKKDRQIHKLYSLDIASSDNLYYDYNLSMIIYVKDNIKHVLPIIFISEYYLNQNYFKPRFDKTDKIFKKIKYYGNGYDVIIQSIVIHKYKLYYDINTLEKIFSSKNLSSYAKDIEIKIKKYIEIESQSLLNNNQIENTETVSEDTKNYIIEPLNSNKNWYKEDNNSVKRSSLNIFTNLNKTFGLLFGIGSLVNAESYKSIFSIYCGKGGDIGKYVHNDVSYVVGIDPDPKVLNIFHERRNTYDKEKVKIFKLVTIPLRLEEIDFMDKVHKKIGLEQTFDVIDIQLGIHFSLTQETEKHIMNIITSLSNKNKSPNTRVLISTNDKDNIIELHNYFNKSLGEEVNIHFDKNFMYQIKYKGKKMEIFYPASMNEPTEEYVISKNYLIDLFKSYNFTLINTWSFDQIIQDKELYNQLHNNISRDSTKTFLMHIKNINKNETLVQLLKIFRYYIFELQ